MNDLSLLPEMLGALAAAAGFGGVLGLEREMRRRWAGLRTHMLVALGAAIFVGSVGFLPGAVPGDVARAIQGIAAGVGFIGAGTIFKLTGPLEVRGLTTAASIWLAAAVGAACGVQLYLFAGAAALIGVVVLAVLGSLERRVETSTGAKPGDNAGGTSGSEPALRDGA